MRDFLEGSPIYQNIRVERARLEIDRFQKDFLTPLLEKEGKEEEEEGIYEEVEVKEKEASCSSSCSSDSGAFSSPSGTFSRLSNPDWGLRTREEEDSLLSSSLVHLDREQMSLLYSLSSLSTEDCSLDKSSPHCNPACHTQVTVNGTCLTCRRLTADK
jgi:hypothetical protein